MPIISDTRLTELSARTKPPAVAGLFYPGDADELQRVVRQLLAQVPAGSTPPKALIAPHAGYIYSGPIAATAYATLIPARHTIKRVVLLGPAHRVYLQGLALPGADYFTTPLGSIEIDQQLRDSIAGCPQVSVNDPAFAQEHSLEVQLPFLQTVLDQFTLLPLLVGDASATQVAEILQKVWGGDETLIVISSDLSHYHDYAKAQQLDRQTSDHIRALRFDQFGPGNACGCRPIHGLLQLAAQQDYEIDILDVRNSGDTAGSRDRVVGYGAYALYSTTALRKQHHQTLVDIAANSILHGLEQGRAKIPDLKLLPRVLQTPAAIFVTLMIEGRLRGCIGNTEPVSALAEAVAVSAFNAAFHDPRFSPLTREEFGRAKISISVLSERSELKFESEQALINQLQSGISGLIIRTGPHKATFLPSVWESIPQAEQFLSQLKQKAGIGRHESIEQAWIYSSVSFSGRDPRG